MSFESASGENPYQKIQREKEKMSVLEEREAVIRELRDTIEILQAKMTKMEQLSKLKDSKIESLLKRIEEGT